jgi:hypothetical protein
MMNSQHAEQQLVQLTHRFNHWRECRTTSRERIPEALWDQAVSLTHVLPISRVAKRLGLCGADLKKRCPGPSTTTSAQVSAQAVNFVEVTPPPFWLPASVDVDIQRADGTRMRIACQQQEASLATLVRAFVETR